MLQVPQSVARVVMLKVFATGTTTAATGNTVAVTLSKNGGAFANPAAGATSATEVSNGWYSVALGTGDTGTLGDLVVRGTATGCDDSERVFGVVSAATGGLTNLDAAVSTRSTYAGADTAGTTTLLTRVTGAVLLASGYTAPDNAGIAAVKAKTDNLPGDPADQSLIIAATDAIMTRLGTPAVTIAADVATRLAASAYTSPPAAATVATAVRTELGTELGRIDAAVTTRSSHTAADVWAVATRTLSAFAFSVTLAADQPVDVRKVNGAALAGNGTSESPWGPA